MIDFDTRAKIGNFLPGGTPGSVLFVDASGKLAQDNDKIFWDEINFRLGIKVPAPEEAIHVDGRIRITNGNGFQWGDGSTRIIGNSTAGFTAFFNNNVETFRNISTNRTGFGSILPAAKVHIVPNLTTEIGQIIQGVVSQSADLSQTKDSSGTILGVIAANGYRGLGTNSPNEQLELTENFRFPHTTYNGGNQYGVMYKAGTRFIHNFNYGDNGTVTTLGENLFIGENSGNFLMGSTATQVFQASFNTGVGTATLFSNQRGNSNMAMGYYSLIANVDGSNNFAGGANSLSSNVDGSGNAATGQSSLRGNIDGYWNTASGNDAGRYISGGGANTNSNTSVFLGYDTRPLADSQGNQIVIGHSAIGMGSNTVTLGNTSIVDTYLRGDVHVGIDGAAERELRVYSDRAGDYLSIENYGNYGGFYSHGVDNWLLANTTPYGYITFWTHDGSAFAERARVESNGYWGYFTENPAAVNHIVTDATTAIGQIIQGIVSQSGNLTEWRNSNGTVVAAVNPDGFLGVGIDPLYKMHVYRGASGGTPVAGLDTVVIEDDDNAGLTVLVPNDKFSRFAHGSLSDGFAAGTEWKFDDLLYTIGTANANGEVSIRSANKVEAIRITKNQDAGFGVNDPDEKVEVSGNVRTTTDNDKYYSGTGKDMSTYYDGADGNIKTDEVVPSDLKVSCGADKTIELQEPVYNDLVLPLDSARVPAANAPTWESFVGNLNAYAYGVNDYQEFTVELLHGYRTASDLEFHIHGALNATLAGGDETVKFEIEYSIANMDGADGLGDVFPSTTTINQEFIVPNGTPDLTSIYISVGTDSTGSFGMGATIKGRIRRIASSGTELVGDMFVTQMGVHYEINTLGSRQITAK